MTRCRLVQKEYGDLTEAQVEQFAPLVQNMFEQLDGLRAEFSSDLEMQSRLGTVSMPWAFWYDFSYEEILAIYFWTFGLDEALTQAAQSADPQQEALDGGLSPDSLITEDYGIRLPVEIESDKRDEIAKGWAIGLIMAVFHSAESLGWYGQTISDLLKSAADGNKEKLLKAVLVDASTVGTSVAQNAISLAVVTSDHGFLNELAKAITKTKPRPPADKHRALRYTVSAIYQSNEKVTATQQTVRDLILERLNLYETEEDSERALQRFMNRLFHRWGT